jgi:uncharacterized protein YdeI (YjbR/CyaY-like superfamily)
MRRKSFPTISMNNRDSWRAWLAANHQSADGIWLVHFKKKASAGVGREESVEEALCFGWIDSLVKRIDATRFAVLFTPRKEVTKWSEVNRRRLAKVIAEGRITAAGLAKAPRPGDAPSRPPARLIVPQEPPADFAVALRAKPRAAQFFAGLAPSKRRRYLGWILLAKRAETRARRIAEAVDLLSQHRELGLK